MRDKISKALISALLVAFIGTGCAGQKETVAPTTTTPVVTTPQIEEETTKLVPPVSVPETIEVAEVETEIIRMRTASLPYHPNNDGFSFENFGGGEAPADLTVNMARRLYGDNQVCSSVVDNECTPYPVILQLIGQANRSMQGGLCEGLTVLSLRLANDAQELAGYQGATSVSKLVKEDPALLSELAYWYVTQFAAEVQEQASAFLELDPLTLAQVLLKDFADAEAGNPSTGYTIGIYSEQGGHAVTPYKVEQIEDQYRIYIYDSNWPTSERWIDVDENGWTYALAATNPTEPAEAWGGGIGTMELTPMTSRTGPFSCGFCPADEEADSGTMLTVAGAGSKQMAIKIQTDSGQRLGYYEGKFVNEIPGATYRYLISGTTTADPVLVFLPPDVEDFSAGVEAIDIPTPDIYIENQDTEAPEVILPEQGQEDVTIEPEPEPVSQQFSLLILDDNRSVQIEAEAEIVTLAPETTGNTGEIPSEKEETEQNSGFLPVKPASPSGTLPENTVNPDFLPPAPSGELVNLISFSANTVEIAEIEEATVAIAVENVAVELEMELGIELEIVFSSPEEVAPPSQEPENPVNPEFSGEEGGSEERPTGENTENSGFLTGEGGSEEQVFSQNSLNIGFLEAGGGELLASVELEIPENPENPLETDDFEPDERPEQDPQDPEDPDSGEISGENTPDLSSPVTIELVFDVEAGEIEQEIEEIEAWVASDAEYFRAVATGELAEVLGESYLEEFEEREEWNEELELNTFTEAGEDEIVIDLLSVLTEVEDGYWEDEYWEEVDYDESWFEENIPELTTFAVEIEPEWWLEEQELEEWLDEAIPFAEIEIEIEIDIEMGVEMEDWFELEEIWIEENWIDQEWINPEQLFEELEEQENEETFEEDFRFDEILEEEEEPIEEDWWEMEEPEGVWDEPEVDQEGLDTILDDWDDDEEWWGVEIQIGEQDYLLPPTTTWIDDWDYDEFGEIPLEMLEWSDDEFDLFEEFLDNTPEEEELEVWELDPFLNTEEEWDEWEDEFWFEGSEIEDDWIEDWLPEEEIEEDEFGEIPFEEETEELQETLDELIEEADEFGEIIVEEEWDNPYADCIGTSACENAPSGFDSWAQWESANNPNYVELVPGDPDYIPPPPPPPLPVYWTYSEDLVTSRYSDSSESTVTTVLARGEDGHWYETHTTETTTTTITYTTNGTEQYGCVDSACAINGTTWGEETSAQTVAVTTATEVAPASCSQGGWTGLGDWCIVDSSSRNDYDFVQFSVPTEAQENEACDCTDGDGLMDIRIDAESNLTRAQFSQNNEWGDPYIYLNHDTDTDDGDHSGDTDAITVGNLITQNDDGGNDCGNTCNNPPSSATDADETPNVTLTNGDPVIENVSDQWDSRITRELSAGDYVLRASVYNNANSGWYRLTIRDADVTYP